MAASRLKTRLRASVPLTTSMALRGTASSTAGLKAAGVTDAAASSWCSCSVRRSTFRRSASVVREKVSACAASSSTSCCNSDWLSKAASVWPKADSSGADSSLPESRAAKARRVLSPRSQPERICPAGAASRSVMPAAASSRRGAAAAWTSSAARTSASGPMSTAPGAKAMLLRSASHSVWP